MGKLQHIYEIKNGKLDALKEEKWLMYLMFHNTRNINMEKIVSMDEIEENHILNYVQKTLEILDRLCYEGIVYEVVEKALIWAECAKGGTDYKRDLWLKKGYNLFAHNIGSADIYNNESEEKNMKIKEIVYLLIKTHGLIGQYIRGEVNLRKSLPVYNIVENGLLNKEELESVLKVLNKCVISAVSESLFCDLEREIEESIDIIINQKAVIEYSCKERLRELRKKSIENGENFDREYEKIYNVEIEKKLEEIFSKFDLWYVEAALYDFSLEEFIKIFLLAEREMRDLKAEHLSFEKLMNSIYYQYDGKKMINVYKKRIIEKYLEGIAIEHCIRKYDTTNKEHVRFKIGVNEEIKQVGFVEFVFSPAAEKLIEFCVEAEKSGVLYEQAIILLFDLFGFRKDKYDRFHEEKKYLFTMNQSIDYKKVILDYISGEYVIDIGPGGGAVMDLIEERFPDKRVTGIDISKNVIDTLEKKKRLEAKKWDIIYGDALNLSEYLGEESVDTVIFCSIIHELYSYIEFEGRKFNKNTIESALKSAYKVLRKGGRIIIRDGIMTEPENQKRIIKFLSSDGVEFLKRYAVDFKGREIIYKITGHNEVEMSVNDSMEFLYTYTWGEKSYVHEVNEQFGYFTPSDYLKFIKDIFGDKVRIVKEAHYLQEGYETALKGKIEIYNEKKERVKLPDSTVLIVIEKI